MKKYLRMFFFMSLGSPVLYVGSYLLNVEAYLEKVAGIGQRTVPHYIVGGKTAEQFYAPLQKLDARIRAKHWQGL